MKIGLTADPRWDSPPLFDDSQGFCGSGFLLSGDRPFGLYCTAAHVVPKSGNTWIMVSARNTFESDPLVKVPINKWVVDRSVDLAIGTFDSELPLTGFAIEERAAMKVNADVGTVEHSDSLVTTEDPAVITISPLFRKGHVTRSRSGISPLTPKAQMRELSFPAISGASGAPVFYTRSMLVVGVLVANVDRQLMPVRTVRSFDDSGHINEEEIRYVMPCGLAVAHDHLIDLVDRIDDGSPFDAALC